MNRCKYALGLKAIPKLFVCDMLHAAECAFLKSCRGYFVCKSYSSKLAKNNDLSFVQKKLNSSSWILSYETNIITHFDELKLHFVAVFFKIKRSIKFRGQAIAILKKNSYFCCANKKSHRVWFSAAIFLMFLCLYFFR